ncbi:MAG TPA: PhzF family phenazine biosynthesis protein [Burkholderiaceae bacterium]|nr:PhzF family phenazine biosynthesis protein [Burkholderiaceae bacterium]
MTESRRYSELDVFTAVPLLGNPLAVVHDGRGLSDAQMAAFARWTNLSETTFLLPPTHAEADYRVRIFTPERELPFAGHPTLGSCHAWLDAGGRPRSANEVIQECGVGLVRVRRDGARLAFAAPPIKRSGPLEPELLGRIVDGLGLESGEVADHQWVDNGPGWCAVRLQSAARALELKPDYAKLRGLSLGVVAPHAAGADVQFEVRALIGHGPGYEDPVTGSLNASLAQWLIGSGVAPPQYVAAQGAALKRAGRVHVQRIGADTWIGGDVCAVVAGTVAL